MYQLLGDQLLLLLLAETGFRIGEVLGIRYTQDIDYDNRSIRVECREDNENGARAKNAEYRRAKISAETYEILLYYLAEYRELLKDGEYLFVTLTGKIRENRKRWERYMRCLNVWKQKRA